jgi:hypothetical protein
MEEVWGGELLHTLLSTHPHLHTTTCDLLQAQVRSGRGGAPNPHGATNDALRVMGSAGVPRPPAHTRERSIVRFRKCDRKTGAQQHTVCLCKHDTQCAKRGW